MERKKSQLTLIEDERERQVTFARRSFDLIKKAYELSVLCNCEIALIIFSGSNELFQYASTDMEKILLKFAEYKKPHKSWSNSDVEPLLNKNEHRACDRRDAADSATYALTPNTEAKYKKLNNEFDNTIKSHKMSSLLPPNLPHPGGGGASDGRTTATDNHPQMNAHGIPDTGDTASDCELILQNGSGTDATRFVEYPLMIGTPRSSARKSDPQAHTFAAEVPNATPFRGEPCAPMERATNGTQAICTHEKTLTWFPRHRFPTPNLHNLLIGNECEIRCAEMSLSMDPWQQHMSSAMGTEEWLSLPFDVRTAKDHPQYSCMSLEDTNYARPGVSNISITANPDLIHNPVRRYPAAYGGAAWPVEHPPRRRHNFFPLTIADPEPGDSTSAKRLRGKSLGDLDEWSPSRK